MVAASLTGVPQGRTWLSVSRGEGLSIGGGPAPLQLSSHQPTPSSCTRNALQPRERAPHLPWRRPGPPQRVSGSWPHSEGCRPAEGDLQGKESATIPPAFAGPLCHWPKIKREKTAQELIAYASY